MITLVLKTNMKGFISFIVDVEHRVYHLSFVVCIQWLFQSPPLTRRRKHARSLMWVYGNAWKRDRLKPSNVTTGAVAALYACTEPTRT